MLTKKELKALKKAAQQGASHAYSPYSTIQVGAAVITESGVIYSGANVENISFGGTICAERVAITKAVSEGERKFKGLYLYTKEQWSPCGLCLQVISEFLEANAPIILGSDKEESILTLEDLFPRKIDLLTFKKLQIPKD